MEGHRGFVAKERQAKKDPPMDSNHDLPSLVAASGKNTSAGTLDWTHYHCTRGAYYESLRDLTYKTLNLTYKASTL